MGSTTFRNRAIVAAAAQRVADYAHFGITYHDSLLADT